MVHTRRLQRIYAGLSDASVNATNTALLRITEDMEFNVQSIFEQAVAANDISVINEFNELITVLKYEPAVDQTVESSIDMMDLYLSFIRKARFLATDPDQQTSLSDSGKEPNFRFIIENGPDTLLDNIWRIVFAYQASYRESTLDREILILALMGVGFAIPILLALLLFIPSLFSIKREKKAILNLFLLIPKSDVSKTLRRLQKQRAVQAMSTRASGMETQSEDEGEASEPEDGQTATSGNNNSTKHGVSKKGGETSDAETDASASRRSRLSLRREKKMEVTTVHSKSMTLLQKMILAFTICMLVILGLLTGMLLVILLTTR